jgi:hypothetical protein
VRQPATPCVLCLTRTLIRSLSPIFPNLRSFTQEGDGDGQTADRFQRTVMKGERMSRSTVTAGTKRSHAVIRSITLLGTALLVCHVATQVWKRPACGLSFRRLDENLHNQLSPHRESNFRRRQMDQR